MNQPLNHITYIWQSEEWPQFHYDNSRIQPHLARATLLLGKIAGLHESFSLVEQQQALAEQIAQEAVSSFAIEGQALDIHSVTASVMASLDSRNISHLDNRSPHIAKLMLDARQRQMPLTKERLFSWHRLMFREPQLGMKTIGGWRLGEMQIVSWFMGKYHTEYEAPPPNAVPTEMIGFLDWLNAEDDIPPLIKAGIGHVWFESIHPFEDGNGRLGRLIIEYQIAKMFEEAIPLSPSKAIQNDRKSYYAQLKKAQHSKTMEVTDFLNWFFETVSKGAEDTLESLGFITKRNRFFERWSEQLSKRQEFVLRRLFLEGPERIAIGVSRRPYAKIADVSDPTAVRDIQDLLAKGVLLPSTEKGKATKYPLNFELV